MPEVFDKDQAEHYRGLAKQEADNAYNNSVLQGQSQDRALNAAKFAWQQTMDKAGLTGKFEGEWTIPTQMGFAQTFGSWGAPTAGQKTQSMLGQEFGQGATNAQMYGQYYAPGTGPQAGQQTLGGIRQEADIGAQNAGLFGSWGTPQAGQRTLSAEEQAFTQDLRNKQFGLAEQGQQQNTAQNYLQLLASLRGPADWAKYQEVLGSTPGGMRDLVGAAMGQYVPGGGATTGVRPQAANLQTMMAQVNGQPITPGMTGGQMQMPQSLGMPQQQTPMSAAQQQQFGGPQPSVGSNPQGTQPQPQQAAQQWDPARMAQYQTDPQRQAYYQQQLQQAQGQQQGGYTPMQQSVAQMFQPSAGGVNANGEQTALRDYGASEAMRAQGAYNNQQLNAMGNGTNTMGAQQPGQPQANQMNLPAPNQIAAQSWKNMAPSQQQMLLGAYESQGWHKPDVQALYEQSLPKYAGNAPSAGTFKLGG
jgi:hypothetical protein